MKKLLLLILFFFGIIYMNAQSYSGLLTDNFSGVHGVISNPANITDSRFKTDVNLAGASVFVTNDFYGLNVMDATKSGYDFDVKFDSQGRISDERINPLVNNSAALNLDVLGPAFMFNLTPTSSIAVFSRARTFMNITDINGVNINDEQLLNEPDDYIINQGDFGLFGQAWAEVGLSYARVLLNDGENFLKGGLSLKYLQGAGSLYIYGEDVTIDYKDDGTGNGTGTIDSDGRLTIGAYDSDVFYNDYEGYELPKASGFGLDFGFVYEWRPDYENYIKTNSKGEKLVEKDKNKYKLKLGLSITDIGHINYKGSASDNTAHEDVFDIDISDVGTDDPAKFIDELNRLISPEETTYGYKTYLPTALHLNADWSFNSNFYLNINGDLSLHKKGKERASRITNRITLTPRFETKWYGFYLPLNVTHNAVMLGAGFRSGPLYIGSGSLITVLTGNNTNSGDVYAGIKVPIYQPKLRDKDEDGVFDKLDICPEKYGPVENDGCPWGDADEDGVKDNVDKCPEEAGPKENDGCPWLDKDEDTVLDKDDKCPEEAGPVENDGCPWLDTDGDTVLDKDDKCPETAGPVENKGCPWGDADGDTVLDNEDKCPEVPGPLENNGCPWGDADGDTVLDKDDECVDVFGTVANKGCPEPEVTVEVQKTLNKYAKTILFNSGRATIKDASVGIMQEIVKILEEYPNAKFSIEGHTDSVGSSASNQNLSESRAGAVKVYLIENGIASNRLTSKGYGESKPIADNATAEGRALNRRVEINLVK